MELKRISFEVAKAIKEAGYPQVGYYWYSPQGVECYSESDLDELRYVSAPTYIDVWLWLWREKNIRFDVEDLWDAELSYPERGCASNTNQLGGICTPEVSDPEEAIIAAIKYLVDNSLIK